MKMIVRLVIVAAALATAMCLGVRAGHAYGDAPWCAVVNLGAEDVQWQCEYYTFEDCVPNVVAGTRGFCNRNPYWRPPPAPAATAGQSPRKPNQQ